MSIQLTNDSRFIIYTGDGLRDECTIVRIFSTRGECLDWFRAFAKRQSVPDEKIDSDADLYELMEDEFNFDMIDYKTLCECVHTFGHWEAIALWCLVNHNFDHITEERWLPMEKIAFPTDVRVKAV
jgi:hypothetical protein